MSVAVEILKVVAVCVLLVLMVAVALVLAAAVVAVVGGWQWIVWDADMATPYKLFWSGFGVLFTLGAAVMVAEL